jgi:hypothetical protein
VPLGSHLSRYLRWLPAVLTTVFALTLYSSWNRPLLYDEFVYFVAGGIPTLPQVLDSIHETTTNVNQGVTGAYLLADWGLLQIFGAQAWALRLPSLIFGVLLFLYAGVFFRGQKLGPVAIAMFPIFMMTQELVMRYVGEARTYMPLAAASFGLLAYYSLDSAGRTRAGGRVVGWSAMLIGVMFHPYIALYWPALIMFGFLVLHRGSRNMRGLVQFANMPLVLTGVIIYVTIAGLTWARGRATAYVDPFHFLPGPLPLEIVAQNLYAWVHPVTLIVATAALVAVTLIFVRSHTPVSAAVRQGIHLLAPPAALAVLAYVLALLISVTSIAADFWIFPRQWIASAALTALAVFWGGWRVWAAIARESRFLGRVAGVLLITTVAVAAVSPVTTHIEALMTWSARALQVSPDAGVLRAALEGGETLDDAAWMEFSQTNVDSGGPVWPEFASYYLATDWSMFVLSDGSEERDR